MKKILGAFLIVALLGGCAQFKNLEQTIGWTTASVTNPVTKDKLYAIEESVTILFSGLKAYKAACVQGTADTNCKANVRAIQVYTKQVPTYLNDLRVFVKTNDQINATKVYNALRNLLADVKTYTDKANIKTGN